MKTTATTVSTREARQNFSDVITRVSYGKERVGITRRGEVIAYLVPVEAAEALEELEDAEDLRSAEAALADFEGSNEKAITLEDAARELGIELPK